MAIFTKEELEFKSKRSSQPISIWRWRQI